MGYQNRFRELHIEEGNEEYPHNDIGMAKLFFELHKGRIRYVVESKSWYSFNSRQWVKDDNGFSAMEYCKDFAQALHIYAQANCNDSNEGKAFVKYASGLQSRKRRECILSDARSIQPVSLSVFDKDKLLLNCMNGTFSLRDLALRPHRAEDYITKIAKVKYDPNAVCPRWDRFISEVMCDDTDTALFLQKAYGYALTGENMLECFFILYGNTTRNGKTTLTESVANILGDYARTIQPQTFARRSVDGASPSPDIARLKGARLVNMPEPEKGLELNIALIKQLTGGDSYTGRFLNENPVEFTPEFKIFINTNHLPRTADDTVFSSDRVKLIPFDRHFAPDVQDTGLKKQFRQSDNKSAILNWMIAGYRMLSESGLSAPKHVLDATLAYRQEADIIGTFLSEHTMEQDRNRLSTSELYKLYIEWAKENGYQRPMNSKNFVGELRRRYNVRRDGSIGNVIVGLAILDEANPFL